MSCPVKRYPTKTREFPHAKKSAAQGPAKPNSDAKIRLKNSWID
jgi:hypothetical protein